MAPICHISPETGADSGVKIILCYSYCEIREKRASGPFPHTNERVLIIVKIIII